MAILKGYEFKKVLFLLHHSIELDKRQIHFVISCFNYLKDGGRITEKQSMYLNTLYKNTHVDNHSHYVQEAIRIGNRLTSGL